MPVKISRSRVNLADGRLDQATFQDYGETINALGSVSGTTDIDLQLGNVITATISADTVFTFSNPPASGAAGSFTLILTNGGSSNVTWPGAVRWTSGTAPTLTTSGDDLLAFFTTDGGSVWYGVATIVDSQVAASYGYVLGGGISGSPSALAERINFSTGAFAANTASNLSQARDGQGSVSDANFYGYIAGGETPAGTNVTTGDRITFSTGVTAANTDSNLSTARRYLGGVSDGATYGYFAGGYISGNSAIADRITFSTGVTAANTDSNLTQARYQVHGVSDASTYGYFGGGETAGGIGPVVTTDRITFSTSVTAANTDSNLSSARNGASGLSDGSTYGYFAGGDTGGGTRVVTADRLVFSTGITSANATSNLSQARNSQAAISDSGTYGYFSGGRTGGSTEVTTTDRIVFSTGATSAATASNLNNASWLAGYLSSVAV